MFGKRAVKTQEKKTLKQKPKTIRWLNFAIHHK